MFLPMDCARKMSVSKMLRETTIHDLGTVCITVSICLVQKHGGVKEEINIQHRTKYK